MKLHDLRLRSGVRRRRKRVGRGRASGHGKTSGRGHKGAKSRSGFRRKPGFEGGQMPLIRSVPKRGFHNRFKTQWAEVNLAQLSRFKPGATVDPAALEEAGLVSGLFDGVVVLGRGNLDVALTVRAHRFSRSAACKIQAAGGVVEVIG